MNIPFIKLFKPLTFVLFLGFGQTIFSQTAIPDDTSSVDAMVNAMYNVISGPAGQRDWKRFKNLFTPDAKMGAVVKTKQGKEVFRSFTPDDYIKNNDPYFLKNAFIEKELHREMFSFGRIVQVFTTYEFESGAEKERGINSLQLVRSGDRWWIVSLIWQEESPENPLPKEFLPK